ncbi:MAG: hydrogenase maturation protease [Deltaproteobacteria bacterium]|nr:hydrogenase maturation protease [Deltaproteobacteria bacterium]
MFREIETKEVLILGCGNVLFGDDAFGPEVADRLSVPGVLPDHAYAEDCGTSVRDILFNITVARKRPRMVIIVDAVTLEGRQPGEVFEMDISAMPKIKLPDFSFHQFPTTNMLHEMREQAGIDVRVVACQTAHVPEHVEPGMSAPVIAAVDKAIVLIRQLVTIAPG